MLEALQHSTYTHRFWRTLQCGTGLAKTLLRISTHLKAKGKT